MIAGLTGGNVVPCLSGPVGVAVAAQLGLPAPSPTTNLPAAVCAQILSGALTVNPRPILWSFSGESVRGSTAESFLMTRTNTWHRDDWTTASTRTTSFLSRIDMDMT